MTKGGTSQRSRVCVRACVRPLVLAIAFPFIDLLIAVAGSEIDDERETENNIVKGRAKKSETEQAAVSYKCIDIEKRERERKENKEK